METMSNKLDLEKWVLPFYLNVLHGNYASGLLSESERSEFVLVVNRTLGQLTPDICSELISGHWRESITGSWFAGLKMYEELQDQIGSLLLDSKTCYAGQAYAFAMGCYGNQKSIEYLTKYLDTYLAKVDCQYDQDWAMGALMWIDNSNSSSHSDIYLEPDGLWDDYVKNKLATSDAWDIKEVKSRFFETMRFCQKNFDHI